MTITVNVDFGKREIENFQELVRTIHGTVLQLGREIAVKALESMGFKVTAASGCEAPTLTNCYYMEGVDDAMFRKYALEEGVMLAGALGQYAGKAFRIGHMGNTSRHDMISALAAIERALVRCGIDVEYGKSVGVFQKEMERRL